MPKKLVCLLMLLVLVTLLIGGCFGSKRKLIISVVGEGMVKKTPNDSEKGYKKNSVVKLEAIAAENWQFQGWEGDLSGTNPVSEIKLTKDSTVKAVFTLIAEPTGLNVNVEHDTITVSWAAIEGVAGYNIARSFSETGEKTTLNQEAITGTSYTDIPLATENNYYYWLSAVALGGTSSPWVGPIRAKKKNTLTINTEGQGQVVKSIDDNGTGYEYDQSVRLEAIAVENWQFQGWEGDLSGTNPVAEIMLTKASTVRAVFTLIAEPTGLNVNVEHDAITVSWAAIEGVAGYNIARSFSETGEKTTLNQEVITGTSYSDTPLATENNYYYWLSTVASGGNTSPWAGPIRAKKKNALTINIEGQGQVVKSIDDNGTGYEYDQSVTLEASAHPDYIFVGWQGDASGTEPVTLAMLTNKTVTAVFREVVRRVPAKYATIQTAIDASNEGDTIMVSPGTYQGAINFQGKKNLVLTSENPFDKTKTNSTILSGGSNTFCISVKDNAENITFSGFKFTNCTGVLKIENSQNINLNSCIIESNNAGLWGFISANNAKNLCIEKNSICQNYVEGGGVFYFSNTSTGMLKDNIITANQAKYTGLMIFASVEMTLLNNTIDSNTLENGGAIYASENTVLNLEGNWISNNGGSAYAAVASFNSTLTLKENTIMGNYSSSRGGGLYGSTSTISLIDNLFTDNIGDYSGGAIFVEKSSQLLLDNNSIVNNKATSYGGGIYALDSNLILTNNTIERNQVFGEGTNSVFGGAICASGTAELTLIKNKINFNLANGSSVSGGAIYASGTAKLTLIENVISNNKASPNGTSSNNYSFGGAICAHNASCITLGKNTITDNQALGTSPFGGGLYYYKNAVIKDNKGEILTTPSAIEAASTFSNNLPQNTLKGDM